MSFKKGVKEYVKRVIYKADFKGRFLAPYDNYSSARLATASFNRTISKSFVERLKRSYREMVGNTKNLPDSQVWGREFVARHQSIHNSMLSSCSESARRLLSDPWLSDLHFGFENSCASLKDATRLEDRYEAFLAFDSLYRACVQAGLVSLFNPEARTIKGNHSRLTLRPDDLVQLLEGFFGIPLSISNSVPGESGLSTCRGVVTFREAQAIFQAVRLQQFVNGVSGGTVLEVGGGMGRTALKSYQLIGVSYSIVDIPITIVAAACYLSLYVAEDELRLPYEDFNASINLVSVSEFLDGSYSNTPAIIFNCDSFTEMERVTCSHYLSTARRIGASVLSINHEANSFSVAQCVREIKPWGLYNRVPSLGRSGYMEDLIIADNLNRLP